MQAWTPIHTLTHQTFQNPLLVKWLYQAPMAEVNKAPLTLHFPLSFSVYFLSWLFLSSSLSLFSSLPLPSIHLTLLLSPLPLISPLQPFSGLYREGSNLRFILPPISNLRDPCCWRRIFRGPDVSRPVKLKSVKNGKIFQWLPMFIEQQDQKHHSWSVHRCIG